MTYKQNLRRRHKLLELALQSCYSPALRAEHRAVYALLHKQGYQELTTLKRRLEEAIVYLTRAIDAAAALERTNG